MSEDTFGEVGWSLSRRRQCQSLFRSRRMSTTNSGNLRNPVNHVERVVFECLLWVKRQERQWKYADYRASDEIEQAPDKQRPVSHPAGWSEPSDDEYDVDQRGVSGFRAEQRLPGKIGQVVDEHAQP